jgi:hypothetical protein
MATIRVSVLIDVANDIEDPNDIKDKLLIAVNKMTISSPNKFLIKELDEDDESDWEEIEEHGELITLITV